MKNLTAKKTFQLVLVIVFMLIFSPVFGENEKVNYQELDKEIVRAYNNIPRDNLKVYGNSFKILKKAEEDNTNIGKAWKLKAQKLITISCFYECTNAIDKKLYRQAYIWAKRGVKRGTAVGKIGDVTLKSLYDYLSFAASELQETPVVKNSNQNSILWQIDNFQYSVIDKKVEAVRNKGKLLNSRLTKEYYRLIEGPALDSSGNFFVKVAVVDEGDFIINKYLPHGWQSGVVSGYYNTWQKCAEEIYKQRIL